MYDERNIEEVKIEDQKTEEIKSYVDSKTGLIYQDYSYFFSHSCGDDDD
jgi:non-homologous end joining protein Ku